MKTRDTELLEGILTVLLVMANRMANEQLRDETSMPIRIALQKDLDLLELVEAVLYEDN